VGADAPASRRISRRVQLIAFGGVALVFLIAFLFLRPPSGALSDAEYVAMAKDTPQGQLFFRKYDATCRVTRVWTVQVNCDHVPAGATATEKFRVHIDPRTNRVIDVEAQFTP
jgi:hypothetical protein